MQRYLSRIPLPDSLPVYDRLLLAEDGNMWVRQFTVPGEQDSKWWVFGQDGYLKGQLILPSTSEILEAHTDRLVVLHAPPDEPEIVVIYPIAE
ncbi:hypothetical protein BH23GEM10_BH23GEM10_04820 [soil metagenome]